MNARILVASTLTCLSVVVSASQVFRSRADLVLVDVVVRQGSKPVHGLGAMDFQLFDNGLPQDILEAQLEQLPIDLTVVIDSSGSTSAVVHEFQARTRQLMALLRGQDRIRVMAFATGVDELLPLQSPRGGLELSRQFPTGGTSLNDALVLSLTRRPTAGRRDLIVAFSDGRDTTSISEAADVARTARFSNSVLHVLAPPEPATAANRLPDRFRLIQEAAEATGGAGGLLTEDAMKSLQAVLEEFRDSYVLSYSPKGTSGTGWHTISVRIQRPDAARLTVRFRKGYFVPPS